MPEQKSMKRKSLGVLAIIFGILVIIKPSLLAILVGVYLIISGLANLMG